MSGILVSHASSMLEADPTTLARMNRPDAVHLIPVSDGSEAYRALDYIPDETGDTQGGFRITVMDDEKLTANRAAVLAADRQEAIDLSEDMTPKLGFMLRCLRIAIERGRVDPAFAMRKTGGAKAKWTVPASVDASTRIVRAGDGFGPDRGVSPAMMERMSGRAAKNEVASDEPYVGLHTHYTCLPDGFPGRFGSTGWFGISTMDQAMTQANLDIPPKDKTLLVQGVGAAGGQALEAAKQILEPQGFRTVVVSDVNVALVARDYDVGIRQDVDYSIDSRGRLENWDPTTADPIPAEEALVQRAGAKLLAAAEGQITRHNRAKVLQGVHVLGEIANLGVDGDAALDIETENPDTLVVPVPLASGGGVLFSLFERNRAEIEAKLGRPVTAEDSMHILAEVAMIGAELMLAEREQYGIGSFSAAYKIGLAEQYDLVSKVA